MRESFEYLMSLSNKELRKEIENSNWSFILQELRYAGEEIERLNNTIDKAIEYIENDTFKCKNQEEQLKYDSDLLDILKGSDSNDNSSNNI